MLKQFKAKSKRLLDLMINSIYTNKEIFLREVISNASDAIDKLHFISLTDAKASRDFEIVLGVNKADGTISIADNGIGMDKEDLENNLGTIAKSGTLDFKKENEKEAEKMIGQFGVGFYSCFMVAEEVTVMSYKYGAAEAYEWKSRGADGYSIKTVPAPGQSGTVVTLKLKADDADFKYSDYLSTDALSGLVKKYSDYIRYPIKAEMEKSVPKKEGGGYDKVVEVETLNSMTPIWKRAKGKVKQDEYDEFYRDTFHDFEKPLKTISTKVEGNVDYSALLFIPSKPPYDFFTKDFKGGLKLYSAGVLIMDNCEKLLPDYLAFVRGIVDTSDLSLNISREMLQHDRQLSAIAVSLEKKILAELGKMRDNDREAYEKFFKQFGITIKYGAYNGYGAKIKDLQDYFLFWSTDGEKYVTLKEYVAAMKEGQSGIYYASGSDIKKLGGLPQVSALKSKGFGVLLLADNVDEFIVKIMMSYADKTFISALGGDLDLASEDEKKAAADKEAQTKPILDGIKAALGDKVKEVKLSGMLGDFASGLSASGDLSIEMAKVLSAMPGGEKLKPDFVLELNSEHPLFKKAEELHTADKEKFDRLALLFYEEAQLTLGNAPEQPAELVKLINEFVGK